MWTLIIITMFVLNGPTKETTLEHYDTKQECIKEMHRIAEAMYEAYPNEKELFSFECRATPVRSL